MSYYGSWKIDDTLTFTANTHTAATGAATDADSPPTYRVYEDETGTPILTGTMALLDSANTTGFYSEQITLSAANGFEKGKSYNIYISGTVATITGTVSHSFQLEAEVDANTVSGAADVWTYATRTLTQSAGSVTAAVSGSALSLLRGDRITASITGLGDLSSYVSLDFSVKQDKNDTDANAILRIRKNQSGTGDGLLVLNASTSGFNDTAGSITLDNDTAGNVTIAIEADASDDLVPCGGLYYDIQMITATAVSTLTDGSADITADITRLIA